MVYKEEEKRWKGPFTAKKVDSKQAYFDRDHNGKLSQYSVDDLIPEQSISEDVPLKPVHHCLSRFQSRKHPELFLTEVLSMGDRRGIFNSPEKKIESLVKRCNFEVFMKEDVPKEASVLGGNFVLAVKNKDSNEEIFKARYVVQGHTEKEKTLLVHSSRNLRQGSTRTITALAAIFGLNMSHRRTCTLLRSSCANFALTSSVHPPDQGIQAFGKPIATSAQTTLRPRKFR